MYGAKAGKLVAKMAAAKQRGRVDAPGQNSTTRHNAALDVLRKRSLQGSGGSYLQGSAPNLQGFNSGSTRRLQ